MGIVPLSTEVQVTTNLNSKREFTVISIIPNSENYIPVLTLVYQGSTDTINNVNTLNFNREGFIKVIPILGEGELLFTDVDFDGGVESNYLGFIANNLVVRDEINILFLSKNFTKLLYFS